MNAPGIAAVTSLRAQLWDAGFRPVPVFNADADVSSPGKQPLGKAWQIDARRDPPFCAKSPAVAHALNSGILCDGLRPIDYDIDDQAIVRQCCAIATDMFGEAPIRMRKGSPRCLVLYRAAVGEPSKIVLSGRLGKIEILGRGQQFVAFGRHPSGAELEWFPDPPGHEQRDALPAVTEDEIADFLSACAPIIDAPPPSRVNGQDHAPGEPQADTLRIAAALASIPNGGPPDWEQWNRVGMAVWRATGGSSAGWEAWNAWSARSGAYDPDATRARWDHYATSPPTSIGAGTIFRMAAEARRQRDEPPPFGSHDNEADPHGTHRPNGEDAAPEPPPADEENSASEQPHNDPSPRGWAQPLDFFADTEGTTAELRAEHLPAALWPFLQDTSPRMGVDPTSVVLAALVSCASVMSDEWRIQPKRYDTTWTENPRLWAAIVGDPSILKTPVIAACTRPIDRLDAQARERHQEEMREYKARLAVWKVSEDKDSTPEPRQPKLARYIVEGSTIEALSEVLRDDDEARQHAPAKKVLSRHDEMAELIANLDRYRTGGRGGGDRGAYLRLYNGGRHTIDRIGRGSFAIPNWSACFLGGIQPGPIQRIAKAADDDGLLQRFMYSVAGKQLPGLDRKPDAAALQRYEALFPKLSAMHPQKPAGGHESHAIVLHQQAHQHREDIDALARAMAALPDTSPRLRAAFGKWPGLFARLCLTFHLIDVADARGTRAPSHYLDVVPEVTARRVASFMHDIVLPHLLRAEAVMFSTAQTTHAQWIAGHILALRMDRITTRDVVRAYRALSSPEASDERAAVMASLVTINWLEPEVPRNRVKPVSAWAVNPAVHTVFEARAEREREARDRARERIAADIEVLRRKRRETQA